MSGGGLVSVKLSGKGEMKSVKIDDTLQAPPPTASWSSSASAAASRRPCVQHRPSGAARGQRTRSSVYTRSSSDGSKPRPCCRRPIRLRCYSGRSSPQDRSTCAKLTVGRRLPQTPSTNRLTSLPDSVLSKCRRSRHAEFQHIKRRHPALRTFPITACPPSFTCTCSTLTNCEPPFLKRRRTSTWAV
jgi:hypothetical protein